MTLAQALRQAAALGLDRLDAQLLLLHSLGRAQGDRAWLLAHDTDEFAQTSSDAFESLCIRRVAGEPVAYLTGHKEFFGLDLRVDKRVLVPRPDTETLVEWVLELVSTRTGPRVIDLGTGSGAIALATKSQRADAHVEATDASADALTVAQANAQRLGLDVPMREASWLQGAHEAAYDVIASNPPYIAAGDPHLPALVHEPLSALASGADGLADIRQIVRQAPACLKPGGWLVLEHGYDQAQAVRELLSSQGFSEVGSRLDLAGIERCSGGRWLELG